MVVVACHYKHTTTNTDVLRSYFINSTVTNTVLCSLLKHNKYLEMVQYKRINMTTNLEEHDYKSSFAYYHLSYLNLYLKKMLNNKQ